MTQRNDGGPAYPIPCQFDVSRGPRFESGYGGMSLRDYFAAKAMQGLLANPGGPIQANGMNGWSLTNCTGADVATMAYAMADAMLAARERT
ncbi:hypothetical protein [Castellaniella sp.]|uniref:hypothetical protein n=1 Tax=Castellaniella sp. TaxID=1955812 RepID=UPI002AFF6524|nr:hypothetical protein [Castellaniella sp.]